jgi:hypothetical protein
MAKSADAALKKWSANSQGATQNYVDGVNAVTTDPGELAARQKQAYVAGVNNNADYWAKRVKTGVENWRSATVNKGGQRYGQGIAAGEQKMGQFLQNFIPKVNAIAANLPPRGTDQQNEARMLQQVRETRKLRGTV